MKVSDFDYHLPEELIAQEPVEPRDASRLLVVHRETGALRHRVFRDIIEYLEPRCYEIRMLHQTPPAAIESPFSACSVPSIGSSVTALLIFESLLATDKRECIRLSPVP
jgi:hypothetical protein